MIRARFRVYAEDSRPVEWPIKHPYWVTGYGDAYDILVAYADDEAEILRLWPEAEKIDAEPADTYKFTSRFYEPEWFKAQQAAPDVNADVRELVEGANRALTAWDNTTLPRVNDGMFQERMESLRAALAKFAHPHQCAGGNDGR